jgi:DNA-binding transcriptional ArsR family regulator
MSSSGTFMRQPRAAGAVVPEVGGRGPGSRVIVRISAWGRSTRVQRARLLDACACSAGGMAPSFGCFGRSDFSGRVLRCKRDRRSIRRSTRSAKGDVGSPTKLVTQAGGNLLIDRIRRDIQERLEQLLAEAQKLRRALDPRQRPAPPPPPARATPRPAPTRTRSPGAASARGRTAPGATKSKVLAALAKGGAMTAGEVASATGVGRGTVSTTLSRLVKSGEVLKAERGYRLPDRGGAAAADASAAEAAKPGR